MNARCPECGRSWEDARRTGRLGCPSCWDSFRTELDQILSEVHGAKVHPDLPAPTDQARQLRKSTVEADLETAIAREDYLEAGRLRDLLKDLPE
ncbi:MAG: UvrB/UvrC motif-containing protein [Fibrobacterota bacterium]|nr:UvrB/UvrC motif-containing protein [Fibrobacterota bacterium]QQS04132.1 MAG: UvrB/UvrC motif-containing protein [Fibrobacterota bacterium]